MPYEGLSGGDPYTSVVAVGTTPTLLVPARKPPGGYRVSLAIQNVGAVDVFLGSATVAASGANRGYKLGAGLSFSDSTIGGALYGVVVSGTGDLTVLEVLP